MTEGNTGHTAECKYYETGNIKDCDCKKKLQESDYHPCETGCETMRRNGKRTCLVCEYSLDG